MDDGDWFLIAVLFIPFIIAAVVCYGIPNYGCNQANPDKEMYVSIESSIPYMPHISDYECTYYECTYETKSSYPYGEKQVCVRSTSQHGYVILKDGECDFE
jgi:hypothetical protein